VKVRQVVVVVLNTLDHIPMPETVSTSGTDARLGTDHRSGQDVIAGVTELPVGAAAGLFACRIGDVVGVVTAQARDSVGTAELVEDS
jgi:hypothetical protein